ncbi:hypothetical protein ACN20G_04985 [Streptomyces sp. BI20]|uniref:hypothetical protein n=1 Tax=Streptomyces sp. BI20 TaxID=3403460 RepID=UPI003C76DE14
MERAAHPVVILDEAGRVRGSGFVADGHGTVLTAASVVAGAATARVRLDGRELTGPVETCGPLAVVHCGLPTLPRPVAAPETPTAPGAYVRLWAAGPRQARILAAGPDAGLTLALGTDGTDALRTAAETPGGPVWDPSTTAVLGVLLAPDPTGPARAADLRAHVLAAPHGPVAAALARAAHRPGPIPDAAEASTLAALTTAPAALPAVHVQRPDLRAEFGPGQRVLSCVGRPGSGRSTLLAALARTRTDAGLPTLWLRGAEIDPTDRDLDAALDRILARAARHADLPVHDTPGVTTALRAAGREPWILLDGPEEMPPAVVDRLPAFLAATTARLLAHGARLVLATCPEFHEQAAPHLPAPLRAPDLTVGPLGHPQAHELRTRLGLPADSLPPADRRHPLALRARAEIAAAGAPLGAPTRPELYAAHLALGCLRAAGRIAAHTGREHPRELTREALRIEGALHEAARRCLTHGALRRADFEELLPWRTGRAAAVLAEGLLVPAGPDYRFADEECADWLQARHLDLPAALRALLVDPGLGPVPPHRVGPVAAALLTLTPTALTPWLRLCGQALDAPDARRWWAHRLLTGTLTALPDARPHLPLLTALAAAHPDGPLTPAFWRELPLPDPGLPDELADTLATTPGTAAAHLLDRLADAHDVHRWAHDPRPEHRAHAAARAPAVAARARPEDRPLLRAAAHALLAHARSPHPAALAVLLHDPGTRPDVLTGLEAPDAPPADPLVRAALAAVLPGLSEPEAGRVRALLAPVPTDAGARTGTWHP